MGIASYLKGLLADPLFIRVCMALWGLPFLTLGIAVAVQWRPADFWEWVGFGLAELVGVYGAYLLYTASLSSAERVEKATEFMADGADIVGLVFAFAVAALAIPITLALRAIASQRSGRG